MTHTQENDMSENKSGFEIRADLLNQAQGLLENNYQRQVDGIFLHNENNPNDLQSLPLRESTGDCCCKTTK